MKITILFALLSAVASQVYRGQPLDDLSMNFLVRVNARYRVPRGILPSSGGGIIVSDRMILTAAHVVADTTNFLNLPVEVDVVAGVKLLGRTPESGVQVQMVKNNRVHVHQNFWQNFLYGQVDWRYDVALIFLLKPLTMGAMVQVATLRQPPINNYGHACQVMGWGRTSKFVRNAWGGRTELVDTHPIQAMIGWVKILDPFQCQFSGSDLGRHFQWTHHLCYGCERRQNVEMCQAPGSGDSGGPLVCRDGNNIYVVAVHTMGCNQDDIACRPETPSAGLKINQEMEEWINMMKDWQRTEDQNEQPEYQLLWANDRTHAPVRGSGGLPGNYRFEIARQL